ncbi:MAG TPA: 50S ribosomal protein L20 [Patescibacteria group bacterium]|nr:50S ribosomal protein L20 [Patescibacteria group bacterium]
MRVKRGIVSRRKHNKLLQLAKGYRGTRSRLVRTAKQAVLQAGQYAFQGRKNRKRDMRSLWIVRISEAVKPYEFSYSVFINQLHKTKIELDRKILSDLVVNDPEVFRQIVHKVKNIH